jgi:hypothetical protein
MDNHVRQIKRGLLIAIGTPLLMALAAPVAPLVGQCRLLIEPDRLAPADKPRWYGTLDRDPGPGFVAAKETVAFLRVDGLMPDGSKIIDKVVEYVVRSFSYRATCRTTAHYKTLSGSLRDSSSLKPDVRLEHAEHFWCCPVDVCRMRDGTRDRYDRLWRQ